MGADSLAENTQNAPPNFWPNLSVQPQKSLEFSKKKLFLGVRSPCSKGKRSIAKAVFLDCFGILQHFHG